jgi:lipoprotein NlpI
MMHRSIAGTIFAALLLLLVAPARAASPADHDACVKGSGDAAIAGCAAIIADRNESNRSRAAAHFNRGYEWRAKGDLDRALADHTMAIRLQPTPAIYTSRGDVWREKGDVDRAIIDYGEAIRLDATSVAAFYRRGLAWREKDEIDRAMSDFTSAIRLDPNHADAYKHRGVANFEKGEFLSAASDLLHAVEIKDDAYLLLWRYLTRGRVGQDGATELAVGAARLASKDWPFALIELYLGKRTDEEIRASMLKPNEMCEAAFFVGQFQLLRGNRAEARSALQAATEICPKRLVEYDGAVAELRRLGIVPSSR